MVGMAGLHGPGLETVTLPVTLVRYELRGVVGKESFDVGIKSKVGLCFSNLAAGTTLPMHPQATVLTTPVPQAKPL